MMVYTVVIHAPAIDEVVTVAAESAAHAQSLAIASALQRQAEAATVTVEKVET
jgi:hypothetical protein